MKLPDLEAWAVFARVAEAQSFSRAALALGVSKATVSKAVARLEHRLGTPLLNRTSRRLALTEAGRAASLRAVEILAVGEAAEEDLRETAETIGGLVRLTMPMSFGIAHVAPLLPGFLAAHPRVSLDVHLSDERIDLVGGGYDLAIRIAALPDSSLRARRLCAIRRALVAAPRYLDRHGSPTHPLDLTDHACLGYAYLAHPRRWHFTGRDGETVNAEVRGPLTANNAEALMPALLSGTGLAVAPDFMVSGHVAAGRLVTLMPGWSVPAVDLSLVTPPGRLRAPRVEALVGHLATHLRGEAWALPRPIA